MLSIMRRQARSWMIKIILFAIVVVFAFWGVGGFDTAQENPVAVVNGEPISYAAYRENFNRLREQYRRAYGAQMDEQTLQSLRLNQQALDQLIDRAVMLQEARRLNIQIPDNQLDQAILAIPAFQGEHGFDEERAGFILAQNRMTTSDFRTIYREDLMIDKLRRLVLEGVTVSEAEAREWFDWYHAEANLEALLFSYERHPDVKPTEEEIAAYFEENPEQYRTDPKVKAVYVHLDPAGFRDQVSIAEDRIAQYYQENAAEFRVEKTVEARHILLRLEEDADAQTVGEQEEKARMVYGLATQEGQSFEALAREYSEGPSRDQGGYLGAFKREEMVKPFADRAFAMSPGEVSEPVRTRFGWHIIKVEKVNEAEHQSIEDAAATIRERLVAQEARSLARAKAEEIYDNTFDGDDLTAAAQSRQLTYGVTDFFTTRDRAFEGVANGRPLVEAAFDLDVMGISEPIEVEEGYFLLQVTETIAATVPPLETVREKVEADVTRQLRNAHAKAVAEAALAALQEGKPLSEVAAEHELETIETGFFKRGGTIPEIGYQPDILQAAFALRPEQPLPESVFEGTEGWYVVRLKDRKRPDDTQFVTEKENLLEQLPERKKENVFQQWLADLRSRGRIEIETQLIQ
ncbi:peptidylprolyl isomerase [Desulfatitalea alkaliphila]|uniref:Periplasmic chaperone PpiD n=1 Tax=Desulfatitalea alkaliphila TaxID=2929485 RepID=A0AA41UQ59_9BACT|nr:peptidylprolyl isomerase [Desulfatitalea alkaliphila]MCJ8501088.1 SurA N-terminal domain-containing protein [Desulfatitalea alkaliphila]